MKYHIINKLSMLLGVILIGYFWSSLAVAEDFDKIKIQVINDTSSATLCVQKHNGSVVSNSCSGSNPYQCVSGNEIETSDDSGTSTANYMYIYPYYSYVGASGGSCDTSQMLATGTVYYGSDNDDCSSHCCVTKSGDGGGYTFTAEQSEDNDNGSVKCTITITE